MLWTIMKMKKMRTLDTRSINTFSTSTRMFRVAKASFLSLLLKKNHFCGKKLLNQKVPDFDNGNRDSDEGEQDRDSIECHQFFQVGDINSQNIRQTVVTLQPELEICL